MFGTGVTASTVLGCDSRDHALNNAFMHANKRAFTALVVSPVRVFLSHVHGT